MDSRRSILGIGEVAPEADAMCFDSGAWAPHQRNTVNLHC